MAVDMSRVDDARSLADVLERLRLNADDLFALGENEWRSAACFAKVQTPIDDATKALVHHRLTIRADLEGTDPLIGLPQ